MNLRSRHPVSLLLLVVSALLWAWQPAMAQAGPPAQMRAVVDATLATLKASDRQSILTYAEDVLAPGYRRSRSDEKWVEYVESLRAAVQPHADELGVEGEPAGVRLIFGGGHAVQIKLVVGPATDWKIAELSLVDAPTQSRQADSREAAVRQHAKAIERLGQLPVEAGLRLLESEHFVPALLVGDARKAMLSDLTGLRSVIAAAGMINLDERGDRMALQFRGGRPADVVFALAAEPPFRISHFSIDLDPPIAAREPAPRLGWEQLDERLHAAERDGYSGVVIAQRGGKTVLAKSYGYADRAAQRAATVDTLFDIGSMPIDFTRAAILLLKQEGRLSMDDRLGKFFADVPADKRDIRLAQLMDGSSGLPNFHHRDGDADKDLSWIDRDTALARILEQTLLFAPGEGRSHSHSAFGLLAMVVEKVSGEPYGAFLRKRLFTPAGMSRTGFYGETLGLDAAHFAVGYGKPAATPNIPPLWGPTSWLVNGSGGMVSSVSDMQRGYNYLLSGDLLHGETLQEYQKLRVGVGGSDRGYFFLRVGGDKGDALFLASNSDKGPAANETLVRSLIGMVLPERADGPGP